jgi:uncharacterized CHY-type Zn-finger protein
VHDFVINPVLRQARRFSRSSITNERIDPFPNRQTSHAANNSCNETEITESSGAYGEDVAGDILGHVLDRPIVSSPIEDNGGLEVEFTAPRVTDSNNAREGSNAVPLRLVSLHPSQVTIDNDISENLSFSPIGSSYNSISRHQTTDLMESPIRQDQDQARSIAFSVGTRQRNKSLPADDGMGHLRRRIVAIQKMDVAASEKARLMHQLLTEGYTQSQINQQASLAPQTQSISRVSQERPTTPMSLSSFSFWQKSTNDTPPESSPTGSHQTFQLSRDDLRPTYVPRDAHPAASSGSVDVEEVDETRSLGCQHYKRNVKLQCFTCNRWYTCRFCHDEMEDHHVNRKETRNMLCMLCGYAQRAGDTCIDCGVRAAWYYCNICHLWDDDANKSIYHCNDCGICRRGRGIGKDFVHCKVSFVTASNRDEAKFLQTCGVCVAIAMENSHKCIERASDCDCPICGEYLFSSPQTVIFMKCGHSIHRICYDALIETSYKCPICSQSLVNMETQFRNLDRAIESQPMPPQFQDTKAMISCNDCYAKSLVKYHWLGLKCAICDSYNTVQLQIMSDPETDNLVIPTVETSDEFMEDAASTETMGIASSNAGPSRSRRHSTHVGPATTGVQLSSRFSPYLIPQRMGRSLSPIGRSSLHGNPIYIEGQHGEEGESDEEDDVDFWGRDGQRSAVSGPETAEEEGGSEDSEEESLASIEEGEDDGDEEDCMNIFGHR